MVYYFALFLGLAKIDQGEKLKEALAIVSILNEDIGRIIIKISEVYESKW